MRIVITDTEIESKPGDIVIKKDGEIHSCRGCFYCWFITPGTCAVVDNYRTIGRKFSMGDELVIVSRCLFGGYSPFVKNVLDRAIAYVQPFFEVKRGDKMCHKRRYDNTLRVKAIFYGKTDEEEKSTARKLVAANARNLRAEVDEILFYAQENFTEV